MTKSEKKQILRKPRQLYQRILRLQEQRAALWAQSYSSPVLDRAPAGTAGGSRIEQTAEAADRIERKIKESLREYDATLRNISRAIKKLPDDRQKRLMTLLYYGELQSDETIRFCNLSEAAEIMHYSERNIKYLHKKALENIML